eukprot:5569543-Pyramimonas_sp.AAC.1
MATTATDPARATKYSSGCQHDYAHGPTARGSAKDARLRPAQTKPTEKAEEDNHQGADMPPSDSQQSKPEATPTSPTT